MSSATIVCPILILYEFASKDKSSFTLTFGIIKPKSFETCFLILVIFEINGPADFLSVESTNDIKPYPKSRDIEALSDTSSISIFPIFSSSFFDSGCSSIWFNPSRLEVNHAISPDKNAPVKNNVFGIPGTKPKRSRTAETGTHALDRPICFDICPAKSLLSDDILVTIVAVAIASSNDGIWATRPSPTVRSMYVSADSLIVRSCITEPIISPPIIFMTKIKIPAIASPFTNFAAPSIAP